MGAAKGDLIVVHFAAELTRLNDAELVVFRSIRLFEYLDPSTSYYFSVIEFQLYDASLKLYAELTTKVSSTGDR